jgi:nuclear transcription Y subunit beta
MEHLGGGHSTGATVVREQERFLPVANISRIMKKALPSNAKIAKDAKETVQECVSEFISFVTSEASDKCQKQKRKTINGDDLLWAMSTLGFENYVEPLKLYLRRFREVRLCCHALLDVFSHAVPSTRARNQRSTTESLADLLFHIFYVYMSNLYLILKSPSSSWTTCEDPSVSALVVA